MGITTIVAGGIFILFAGLFVGTGIAIFVRAMKKAKTQGVVLKDGVNLQEIELIGKLLKEEAEASKELEVLSAVQKVVGEALAKRVVK